MLPVLVCSWFLRTNEIENATNHPKPSPQAQDKNLCHHDIIKHGRASCRECVRHDFSSQRIGTGDGTKQAALN